MVLLAKTLIHNCTYYQCNTSKKIKKLLQQSTSTVGRASIYQQKHQSYQRNKGILLSLFLCHMQDRTQWKRQVLLVRTFMLTLVVSSILMLILLQQKESTCPEWWSLVARCHINRLKNLALSCSTLYNVPGTGTTILATYNRYTATTN